LLAEEIHQAWVELGASALAGDGVEFGPAQVCQFGGGGVLMITDWCVLENREKYPRRLAVAVPAEATTPRHDEARIPLMGTRMLVSLVRLHGPLEEDHWAKLLIRPLLGSQGEVPQLLPIIG
jgi:hypothetical protein